MSRRKRRHNPSDPAVTYWIVFAALGVGAVTIWAWKNMSDKDRAKTGIGAPTAMQTGSSGVYNWMGAVWPWSAAGALVGLGIAAFKKRSLTTYAGLGSLAGTAAGSVVYVI